MTETQILQTLDHSIDGFYQTFIPLGHPYSYLIDSRLNIFTSADKWAIAAERVGYNPRYGAISLEIYYYGNCLINIDYYNERPVNYYTIDIIDNFNTTVDGELLIDMAEYWLVRGVKIPLTHNPEEYKRANIELADEPSIGIEEAARLLVTKHNDLFRATDRELYKSIPRELNKILVIDEWHHRDFNLQITPGLSDEQIKQIFETNNYRNLSLEEFSALLKQKEIDDNEWNKQEWEQNRPSSYETWQQIAKVIAENNPSCYNPTLSPNSHWRHWPDSGSL